MGNNNISSVDAFVGVTGEIGCVLEELKQYIVDGHMDLSPDEVNWAHVDTADHILEALRSIQLFAVAQ